MSDDARIVSSWDWFEVTGEFYRGTRFFGAVGEVHAANRHDVCLAFPDIYPTDYGNFRYDMVCRTGKSILRQSIKKQCWDYKHDLAWGRPAKMPSCVCGKPVDAHPLFPQNPLRLFILCTGALIDKHDDLGYSWDRIREEYQQLKDD